MGRLCPIRRCADRFSRSARRRWAFSRDSERSRQMSRPPSSHSHERRSKCARNPALCGKRRQIPGGHPACRTAAGYLEQLGNATDQPAIFRKRCQRNRFFSRLLLHPARIRLSSSIGGEKRSPKASASSLFSNAFANHGLDSFRRMLRARYSLISLCRGTGWQTFVTGF